MTPAVCSRTRDVRCPACGFTLLEVLVVVLLMAVTVSFVVVNLGPDDREKLRGEASRLAASIQQAQDEAVMTGTTLAWVGEGDSYHYLRRGPGGDWMFLAGEDAFPPHRLPAPVRVIDVEMGGRKLTRAMVVLSPVALAAPVRIVLEADSERAAVELGATTRVVAYRGA
jgi:type II secretion system protein H